MVVFFAALQLENTLYPIELEIHIVISLYNVLFDRVPIIGAVLKKFKPTGKRTTG